MLYSVLLLADGTVLYDKDSNRLDNVDFIHALGKCMTGAANLVLL
jgi:hypothetical protein